MKELTLERQIVVQRNWIDNVVAYLSPRAGYRRDQFRLAQQMLRKYEGASAGSRTGGWRTRGTSANAEVGPSLHLLRDRMRALVRDNPYAGKAVNILVDHTVGTGILCQLDSPSVNAKNKATYSWRSWTESTDCDVDGLHDYYGLQALALRTCIEGGESLTVRRWRKPTSESPLPFQLQVLEGDFIDTTKNRILENGGHLIQGVEFDKRGKRVAYWLFNQHPGEQLLSLKQSIISQRVPAEDIIHLYRVDRAGQVRGVPWGSSCIVRIKDFDDYEDALLVKAKIASMFSGFVQDIEMPDSPAAAKEKFAQDLSSGAIEFLPPGKTITFPNPPSASDDGHGIRVLRSIAIGFNVTYEALTGDLSNVNFNSGRMGWIEMYKHVEAMRRRVLMPRWCAGTYRWWLQGATLAGVPTDGVLPSWTPPKKEMVDPTREVPAKIKEIRGGLTTLSEAQRENGWQPEELFAEYSKDVQTLDKLQLTLDCDPRKTALAGTAQSVVQGGDVNAQ